LVLLVHFVVQFFTTKITKNTKAQSRELKTALALRL